MNDLNDDLKNKHIKDIVATSTDLFTAGKKMFESLSTIDPSLSLSKLSPDERIIVCLHLSSWIGSIAHNVVLDRLGRKDNAKISSTMDDLNACISKVEEYAER